MAYLVASIIAVVSAMIIILTRYEADDSSIKAELENMKLMISMIDGYVNTYIESGESLESINFEVLNDEGILIKNSSITPADAGNKATKMSLPNNNIIWQLIPNIADKNASYKLFVDMRNNSALMSRVKFSESFVGREYCKKALFATFETNTNKYDDTVVGEEDFVNDSGTNSDGLFVCTVFK